MLNFDKYRERILMLIDDNGFSGAAAICAVADTNDYKKALDWVVGEYDPRLKNGDGLNPGDWIMVRYYTADKWHKRQFMCFYNGVFYTAEGPFDMVGHHTFSRWHDARLPKEGE